MVTTLSRLPPVGEVATEVSIEGEAMADAVSVVIDRCDVPRRETLLHLVVRLLDPVPADILMSAGADWSLQNTDGWSAHQEAVCTREEAIPPSSRATTLVEETLLKQTKFEDIPTIGRTITSCNRQNSEVLNMLACWITRMPSNFISHEAVRTHKAGGGASKADVDTACPPAANPVAPPLLKFFQKKGSSCSLGIGVCGDKR